MPRIIYNATGYVCILTKKYNWVNFNLCMGVTEKRNDTLAIDAALKDQHRISFILKHLYRIRRAIE